MPAHASGTNIRNAGKSHSAPRVEQTTSQPDSNAAPAFGANQPGWPSISWNEIAIGIYFVGALILLARLCVGLVLARRLMRLAQKIDDARLEDRLAGCARVNRLTVLPRVAQSSLISVPATMGVLQLTILLPEDWREWDDARLSAVLVHEMSHIARLDPLTQRLALVHRAIFWFSPLGWWLNRHLANLAEQASDEAALSSGADCHDYARTLLGFFEALHSAPGRVWWQGVAMAKAGQAERRLERVLGWKGAVTMGAKKTAVLACVVLAIPVICLVASVRPGQQSAQPAPAAAAAPSAVPKPSAAAAASTGASPAAEAEAPEASEAADSVRFAARALSYARRGLYGGNSPHHGYSYAYGDDDDQHFVIVTGKTDSLTMSGSSDDAEHVARLRKRIPGDFIWVQRGEKSYIIRDQATIDRARSFWLPQDELGKEQDALGKLQDELGKQQDALGKRMDEVRVNVPDMTAELDKLKARLRDLSSGATADQIGELQSEIGELQEKLGEVQSHAGDQQSALGNEMEALGQKQEKLGEQQEELGRQQENLARKASRQMKELLDDAIKKGIAQPEPDTGGGATL